MEVRNNEKMEKFLEQKVEQIQNEQAKNIEKAKRNKKSLFTRIGAGIAAGLILITGITHVFKRNKNNAKDNKPTQSTIETTPIINPEDQISINGLGLVYDDPTLQIEKPQYGNTTGDIKKEDLVEKDNTIWKDQEAADNSDKVGEETFDDQNGKYEQDENGDIFEKEEGYEIQDEDGNTKEEGSNESGIPEGYVWDDVLGKLVKEEDAGKYVYVDATYYDENGNVIFEKGDIVLKETLEEIKKNFTTTKPEETKPQQTEPTETKPEETKPEETKPVDEGVVNKDGTYTILGTTYKSKADYEKFISNPDQYAFYNGIIVPITDIPNIVLKSPEETKPEETKPEETKPEETKPEETKPEETNSSEGVINKDGTYTIFGTTYMDIATFEAFILDENSSENYGYYNGVIYPASVIQEMYNQNQKTK